MSVTVNVTGSEGRPQPGTGPGLGQTARRARLLAAGCSLALVLMLNTTGSGAGAAVVLSSAAQITPPGTGTTSSDTPPPTTSTTTTTTTTIAPTGPTTTVPDDDASEWGPGLALAAMMLAALGILALTYVVHFDRTGAREAQLQALRLGASPTAQGEQLTAAAAQAAALGPVAAVAALAAEPAAASAAAAKPAISGTDTVVEVGALSKDLVLSVGTVETPGTWGADPEGIVTIVPAGGQHSRVLVKGVKAGTAKVHASSPGTPGVAEYRIAVVEPKADPKAVTFLVLGSGIGAVVIALIAVGLTAALGFVDKLSTETIAVVLGAAVGAGATAAATRSGQARAAEKDDKTDPTGK